MKKLLEYIFILLTCIVALASLFFYIGFLGYVYTDYGLNYLLIVLNPLNLWNLFAVAIIFLPTLILTLSTIVIMQRGKNKKFFNKQIKSEDYQNPPNITASLSKKSGQIDPELTSLATQKAIR